MAMPATERGGAEMRRRAEALAPLTVRVDAQAARIEVRDRDQRFAYQLGHRGRSCGRWGGPGWLEVTPDPEGGPTMFAVTAAKVMAVVRDAGRHEHPAALTEALALYLERTDGHGAERIVRRLREEIAAGDARERISVRALQARIVECLVAGETLVDLCERGGFLLPSGRADTSWIQRRAGLVPTRCSRSGKLRVARTASYEVFCRIVRALDAEPHEFGV